MKKIAFLSAPAITACIACLTFMVLTRCDGQFEGDEFGLIGGFDGGSTSPFDIDHDGILNVNDTDVDGDGMRNRDDPDIDGDGTLNAADPTPMGAIEPLTVSQHPWQHGTGPKTTINVRFTVLKYTKDSSSSLTVSQTPWVPAMYGRIQEWSTEFKRIVEETAPWLSIVLQLIDVRGELYGLNRSNYWMPVSPPVRGRADGVDLHFVIVNVSGLENLGIGGEGGYNSAQGVDSTFIFISNDLQYGLFLEADVLIHEWLHGVEGRSYAHNYVRPGLHESGDALDLLYPWLSGEARLREVYKGYFTGGLNLNGQAGIHPGWWPSLDYR